ncbi:glycosyltransferase family 2 protein [Mycoplasma sp. 613B]
METKNKITILIPIFNGEKTCKNLLLSITKQTDVRFNVLFLNNGSTDNTKTVLHKFKDENKNNIDIKIIDFVQHSESSHIKNYLIDNCETEFFIFLNFTDELEPNAISEFNKVLYSAEKKYNIILSDFSFSNKNNLLINLFKKRIFIREKYRKNINFEVEQFTFIWNKIINKEWYKSLYLPFYLGYAYEEFSVALVLFLLTDNIYYIHKKLYKYDWNSNADFKSHTTDKIVGIAKNLDYLYLQLKIRNKYELFEKTFEETVLCSIFIHIFYNKNKQNMDKKFQDALKEFYKFIDKYDLETKLSKYRKDFTFKFNNSLRSYDKFRHIKRDF